jgi:uncharacterized membrane protein YoaK (UPF0700 family)
MPTPLLLTLIVLTMVSGLVDAVCYLGLGHVFTANMTGNVVVLGFAAAGAAGFSVTATLTSLALFLAGALCAGWAGSRLTRVNASRRRLLLTAMSAEAVLTGVAALIAALTATVASGWARYVLIALLALAMGVRNATVRRLAVPDMTTTVLTMTLTGLAADSAFAGAGDQGADRSAASKGAARRSTRDKQAEFRRIAAVVAMLLGALAGALMYLHTGAGLPLFIALLAVSVAGVAFLRSKGS